MYVPLGKTTLPTLMFSTYRGWAGRTYHSRSKKRKMRRLGSDVENVP